MYFQPSVGHFEFFRRLREFLSHNVPCRSLFITQFSVLPSTCEVSLRKRFQKPPVNTASLGFVIKRRSANHSWRARLKAAPKEYKYKGTAGDHRQALRAPFPRLIGSNICCLTIKCHGCFCDKETKFMMSDAERPVWAKKYAHCIFQLYATK